MTYRSHVDGLRAIAVLPVVCYHAGLGFSGGFVGVDVFFVISGYLITGLLIRDLEMGRFSLADFWERRVRRIMPALAVVVFATLAVGWLVLVPQDFRDLGRSAVAQALLVSNIHFWQDSGYFTPAAELKPLLHTWSLAVEEQFYFLFPPLLALVWRRFRSWLVPLLIIGAVGSLAVSVVGTYRSPSATFYLLPTRAWELLLGSLLALPSVQRIELPRWLAELLAAVGLAAIVFASFAYTHSTRFPGMAALVPCVGAAAIIFSNSTRQTMTGRLLSFRPVVFIGLVSYSLYLWHWPAVVYANYWSPEPMTETQKALLMTGCLALSILSWRFVEMPFRKRVVFNARTPLFIGAGAVIVGIVGFGLFIVRSDGMPSRLSDDAKRFAEVSRETGTQIEIEVAAAERGEFVAIGDAEGKKVDLLLWGDSHAMAIMPAIDALCRSKSMRGMAATRSSTPPFKDYHEASVYGLRGRELDRYTAAVLEYVRTHKVPNVLLVAMWSRYREYDAQLARTVEQLTNYGANVWILKQVPMQQVNVPTSLACSIMTGRDPLSIGVPISTWAKLSSHADRAVESTKAQGAHVIDPAPFFVSGEKYAVVRDGHALYRDRHHLSMQGALLLRPILSAVVESAVARSQ